MFRCFAHQNFSTFLTMSIFTKWAFLAYFQRKIILYCFISQCIIWGALLHNPPPLEVLGGWVLSPSESLTPSPWASPSPWAARLVPETQVFSPSLWTLQLANGPVHGSNTVQIQNRGVWVTGLFCTVLVDCRCFQDGRSYLLFIIYYIIYCYYYITYFHIFIIILFYSCIIYYCLII